MWQTQHLSTHVGEWYILTAVKSCLPDPWDPSFLDSFDASSQTKYFVMRFSTYWWHLSRKKKGKFFIHTASLVGIKQYTGTTAVLGTARRYTKSYGRKGPWDTKDTVKETPATYSSDATTSLTIKAFLISSLNLATLQSHCFVHNRQGEQTSPSMKRTSHSLPDSTASGSVTRFY